MVSGRRVIAAIGNFDGVHRGHRRLIDETIRFAGAHDAAPGAVMFDPHPRRFFQPDAPPFLLTTLPQRDRLLREAGVAATMVLPFDAALAASAPSDFVALVLRDRLGLAGVVAGADFRFGAKRSGDSAALAALGAAAGLKVAIVDILAENPQAEKYGSSAAREALQRGDVERAAAILGRAWSVAGVVEEGRKVGRTLGFPTANMTLGPLIEPRRGVYATRVRIGDVVCDAVSNFGRRPTFGDGAPLLETHLLDFDGDLYGREIEVAFVAFLREEMKFDGLDALKAQISRDCENARLILDTKAEKS